MRTTTYRLHKMVASSWEPQLKKLGRAYTLSESRTFCSLYILVFVSLSFIEPHVEPWVESPFLQDSDELKKSRKATRPDSHYLWQCNSTPHDAGIKVWGWREAFEIAIGGARKCILSLMVERRWHAFERELLDLRDCFFVKRRTQIS